VPEVRSRDGKPLLSWRVAILPYLEQQELYGQFHHDEPWDSANNKPLSQTMIKTFVAPNAAPPAKQEWGWTNYLYSQLDMKQGGAIMPDALRWLWREYPKPITVKEPEAMGQPGWDSRGKVSSTVWAAKRWEPVGGAYGPLAGLAADRDGNGAAAERGSGRDARTRRELRSATQHRRARSCSDGARGGA